MQLWQKNPEFHTFFFNVLYVINLVKSAVADSSGCSMILEQTHRNYCVQ